MISAVNIALTGLNAATSKLNASASNIANLQTVGSLEDDGQAPYTPVTSQQTAIVGQGVQAAIVPRTQPFIPAYDADSPFADENGIIGVPNTNLAEEIVNLNLAKLQFKANIAVIEAASELDKELLHIFDDEA